MQTVASLLRRVLGLDPPKPPLDIEIPVVITAEEAAEGCERNIQKQATCEACEGTGLQVVTRCGQCGGTGELERFEQLKIIVPAGMVRAGTVLRLGGAGRRRGDERGDVLVVIEIR